MSPVYLAILGVVLSAISSVALGAGAWFFKRLVASTDKLREEIGKLREGLAADAVLRSQHTAAIAELKTEHKALEVRVRAMELKR